MSISKRNPAPCRVADSFMLTRRQLFASVAAAGIASAAATDELPRVSEPLLAAANAARLPRIATTKVMLHHPEPGTYQYAHHPQVAFTPAGFLAMWSSGLDHEDRPGQRVLWSRSEDGRTWAPTQIFRECPEPPWFLTAGGWASDGNRIFGYLIRTRRAVVPSLKTGLVWFPPMYVDVMEADTRLAWGSPRTIDSDLLMNESPRRTSSGTWLIAGYTSRLESGVLRSCAGPAEEYVFHGAPRVDIPLSELKTPRRTPPARPLGEPSWYQRKDGTLVCFFRDDHGSLRLFASLSHDDGVTWSRPVTTNIPDAKSKTAARRLNDGRIVLVSNSCPARRRNVLSILVSEDGITFDRGAILCDEGDGRYAYPSITEHDGQLWVIYTINKHDVAVARFPIDALPATPLA